MDNTLLQVERVGDKIIITLPKKRESVPLIFTPDDENAPVIVTVEPATEDGVFSIPPKLSGVTGDESIPVDTPFVISLSTPDGETANLNEVSLTTTADEVEVTVNGEKTTVSVNCFAVKFS